MANAFKLLDKEIKKIEKIIKDNKGNQKDLINRYELKAEISSIHGKFINWMTEKQEEMRLDYTSKNLLKKHAMKVLNNISRINKNESRDPKRILDLLSELKTEMENTKKFFQEKTTTK